MISDGIYSIRPLSDARLFLALDVPDGQADDGIIIQQYGAHGGPNQQWAITNVTGNIFAIVNVRTKKALDVPNGLPIPGLPVQQYRPHGGPNQQWRFETTPAFRGNDLFRPEYHRIYNVASGLALDVPNGSLEWRVKIQQWTPHNGWNQAWVLLKEP